jgi:diacylglycerol kinase family enzyme
MPRYHLLLNRGSGGNDRGLDPVEVSRMVEEIFREAGHELSSKLVEPGTLEKALEAASALKPDAIIVAGGDGIWAAAEPPWESCRWAPSTSRPAIWACRWR